MAKPSAPYSLLQTYDAVDLGTMLRPGLRVLPRFELFNPGMCLIKDELHLVVRNGINMNDPKHRMLPYASALQKVVLDARTLKIKRLPTKNNVTVDGHPAVVHDVRISQGRIMTGAKRVRGAGTSAFYEPVMGFYKEDEDLEFVPIFHKFDGPNHKNWTHIVDDWFDFGSMENPINPKWPFHAVGRVKNILGDETVSEDDLRKSELWGHRGSAPPVMLNTGLFLGSGHHKEGDSYYHVFWLTPHPERIKSGANITLSLSDRFRFTDGHMYEIQFMTGLVDDPFDSDMMIVAYGADDSHAFIARTRKVDIYGLMA